MRLIELSVASRTTQTFGPFLARARDALNDPGCGMIDAHAVILGVGDQDVSFSVDAQVLGAVEPRLAGIRALASPRVARFADARDGPGLSRPIDDPKRVPAAFENIQVAPAVDRDGPGIHERGRERKVTVSGYSLLAVARDGRDDSGLQVDAAHAAIIEIGEVKSLSGLIEGEAVDPAEFRLGGRPAIARESLAAGARDVGDSARAAVDLADTVVPGISDENISATAGDGQAVQASLSSA